jgi:NAD(P) transhydrogenase subunit alpha
MRIAVLSETDPVETRVAATPDMVKKYKNLGADVVVQAGAGGQASISDAEFEAVGATIAQLAMQSRTPISSSKSAGRPTAN